MIAIVRGIRFLIALLLVLCLAGCAFGTRQPTLIYPPASDAEGSPVAHAAPTPAPRNMQITLNPFADERSDKRVVGTVRNAWGMHTADVIPTNSVPDWVLQAIKTELRNNGYTVSDGTPDGDTESTGIVVSGDILNVYCDMNYSYMGQVSLIARVKKGGKELLNRHYAGEGSAGLAIAMTGESYAQSLALALSSAVKHFVRDLNQSLSSE